MRAEPPREPHTGWSWRAAQAAGGAPETPVPPAIAKLGCMVYTMLSAFVEVRDVSDLSEVKLLIGGLSATETRAPVDTPRASDGRGGS